MYLLISSVLQQYFSMDEDFNDDDNEETESEDENMDTNDPEQPKRGRKRKSWEESSKDSKNRKTDDMMEKIRELASELGTSVFELCVFFGKRDADQNGDAELSRLFKQLNRSKPNGDPKISPLKALAIKKKLQISRNDYEELIRQLGTSNVFPSKDKVKKYEDSIRIELTEFLGGYKANLKDLLIKTIQRILESINYTGSCKKLKVKLSGGFDGSGSHIQRAGKMSNVNTRVRFIFKKFFQNMYALNII